jgi:hypothetical protein
VDLILSLVTIQVAMAVIVRAVVSMVRLSPIALLCDCKAQSGRVSAIVVEMGKLGQTQRCRWALFAKLRELWYNASGV